MLDLISSRLTLMYLATLLWIASVIIGYVCGKKKDQLIPSVLLCVFLGPIGLLITSLLPSKARAA